MSAKSNFIDTDASVLDSKLRFVKVNTDNSVKASIECLIMNSIPFVYKIFYHTEHTE